MRLISFPLKSKQIQLDKVDVIDSAAACRLQPDVIAGLIEKVLCRADSGHSSATAARCVTTFIGTYKDEA